MTSKSKTATTAVKCKWVIRRKSDGRFWRDGNRCDRHSNSCWTDDLGFAKMFASAGSAKGSRGGPGSKRNPAYDEYQKELQGLQAAEGGWQKYHAKVELGLINPPEKVDSWLPLTWEEAGLEVVPVKVELIV